MFDVTRETHDNTFVIILKSRLTLQAILPARASLVTPSLIDDSARPLYYTYIYIYIYIYVCVCVCVCVCGIQPLDIDQQQGTRM